MPIATAALGLYQTISSMSALNKLKKQALPSYTDPRNMDPLLKNREMYMRRFREGLMPEEVAAYQNNVNSAMAGNIRNVSDMFGKQAGGALAASLSYGIRNSALDLAKMQAAYRQSMMSGVAGANNAISNQFNRQTAQDYNYRMAAEQAYGRAMQQGLKNIVDPINFAMMTGQLGSGSWAKVPKGTGGIDVLKAYHNTRLPKGQQTWGVEDFYTEE